MSRVEKVVGFILVVVLGAWGCAKAPESAARGQSLEAKVKKLEEDYRVAAAARDEFRQKLQDAEARLAAEESRARQLQSEGDALKTDLRAMSTQYESFRTNLKALIGDAERALANPASTPPITVGRN
jgi:chromosome segregation ATPase